MPPTGAMSYDPIGRIKWDMPFASLRESVSAVLGNWERVRITETMENDAVF